MWKCDRCSKEWVSFTAPGILKYWHNFGHEEEHAPDTDSMLCPDCGVDFYNFLRAYDKPIGPQELV